MKHIIIKSPPSISVELDYSVHKDLKSYKEEVLDSLYKIYKKHSVDRLLLSDGRDSSFIAMCLKELGISFKPLSIIFSKYQTLTTSKIINFCKSINVTPSFFVIEEEAFLNHVKVLTYDKKIAYPMIMGYYSDFLTTQLQDKFFCGFGSEFRYEGNGELSIGMHTPALLLERYPDFFFNFKNSRVLFSYVNHPMFKKYYKLNQMSIPRPDIWYIRDLIYNSEFSNLSLEPKQPWHDNALVKKFNEFLPEIKKEIPWVFELNKVVFDVNKYFENKHKYIL